MASRIIPVPGPRSPVPMLQPHQQSFLDLVLERGVLRFGDFTLKSGRQSPYFFNMGKIDTGAALAAVGEAYAAAAADSGIAFDKIGRASCRERVDAREGSVC